MKNEKDEHKEYFERNIFLVIIVAAVALFLDWLTIHLLVNVNPWGTATAVPGIVLTLQALWLVVNPYAIVYDDRFEIKQSLFYNQHFYYLDAKAVISKKNSKSLMLVYNDDEQQALPMFGIRSSHKDLLQKKLQEKINISLIGRKEVILN